MPSSARRITENVSVACSGLNMSRRLPADRPRQSRGGDPPVGARRVHRAPRAERKAYASRHRPCRRARVTLRLRPGGRRQLPHAPPLTCIRPSPGRREDRGHGVGLRDPAPAGAVIGRRPLPGLRRPRPRNQWRPGRRSAGREAAEPVVPDHTAATCSRGPPRWCAARPGPPGRASSHIRPATLRRYRVSLRPRPESRAEGGETTREGYCLPRLPYGQGPAAAGGRRVQVRAARRRSGETAHRGASPDRDVAPRFARGDRRAEDIVAEHEGVTLRALLERLRVLGGDEKAEPRRQRSAAGPAQGQ